MFFANPSGMAMFGPSGVPPAPAPPLGLESGPRAGPLRPMRLRRELPPSRAGRRAPGSLAEGLPAPRAAPPEPAAGGDEAGDPRPALARCLRLGLDRKSVV